MKHYFSVKPDSVAQELAKKASKLVEVVDDPAAADIIAAVGGDGSLIHTIYHHHHHDKPFVGINGGSEGAHCLIRRSGLEEGFEVVAQSAPIKINFLDISIGGTKEIAVQDVRLERRTGKTIRVKIELNDQVISRRHAGDGILVTNALGSTGYNRSAGGPILPITSGKLCLTPICPTHSEVAFDNIMEAMVLGNETITITPEDQLCLVSDNREVMIDGGTVVKISKSEKYFLLHPKEAR